MHLRCRIGFCRYPQDACTWKALQDLLQTLVPDSLQTLLAVPVAVLMAMPMAVQVAVLVTVTVSGGATL